MRFKNACVDTYQVQDNGTVSTPATQISQLKYVKMI